MLSDPEAPPGFHTWPVRVTGSDARNSRNVALTNNDGLTEAGGTMWPLSGTMVGFLSQLCMLTIPMLIYGSNTLLFFVYTWSFFLVLMLIIVVMGIALRSLMDEKLRYSIVFTLATADTMFGALPMWLLDQLFLPLYSVHNSIRN